MGNHLRNEKLLQQVSTKLKLIRENKGLTQEDVYNDTGIHISRIESRKVNVTISTLGALCKYYEISMSELFIDITI